MNVIQRSEVYAAIDAERDYQDDKFGKDHPQSLPGFLAIMQSELDEAHRGWIKNLEGRSSPLDEIKQLAAVCVACMERYGTTGITRNTNDIPIVPLNSWE